MLPYMISEYIEQLLAAGWIEPETVIGIENDLHYRFDMLGFPIREVRFKPDAREWPDVEQYWYLMCRGPMAIYVDATTLQSRLDQVGFRALGGFDTSNGWICIADKGVAS